MSGVALEDLFGGAVTVGERGQVVIPAEIRERMAIKAGDKLLVFGHPHGLGVLFLRLEKAIEAQQAVSALMSRVLEISPSEPAEATAGEGEDR